MTCFLKFTGHRTQEHVCTSLLKDKMKYVYKQQEEEIHTGLGLGQVGGVPDGRGGGIWSTGAPVCLELGYIAFLVWMRSPAQKLSEPLLFGSYGSFFT